ncbi:hypothetical protein [Neisseria subflava]|uniref:hypothetical protein n=1 Tax=Neisseria subflava TaxID=28449 RepID=UPI00202A4E44|nr:hypothetical protein [Neisseria subflava]
MLKPTVEGRVESKPIYDNVRQVKQLEYPVACISGGNSGCSCYSSQGSTIKEIDKKTCNEYVKNGLPFNPYKEKRVELSNSETVEKPSANKADSSVLVMEENLSKNLMYDGYVEAGKEFSPNGGVVVQIRKKRSFVFRRPFLFGNWEFWVSRGKVCKDWECFFPNLYEYPLDSQKFKKHAWWEGSRKGFISCSPCHVANAPGGSPKAKPIR